jgi:putative tricarboxylic transport membrane protein
MAKGNGSTLVISFIFLKRRNRNGGNKEMVLEAFFLGFLNIFQLKVLTVMMISMLVGLFFGAVPGIGGNLTLALLIPFAFGMDKITGIAFLLGGHAVVATGSSITAVLINTPGAPMSAATCFDGFPMTQKGQGGRALGAALVSSAVGGVYGAFFLLLAIPVIRPLVMAFRPPELFMMSILGISFIAVLSSKGAQLKGLIAGGVGLLLSLIGFDPVSGVVRFSFGGSYLYEGFDVVPVVIGLFAVTEIVDLMIKGGSIAGESYDVKDSVWEGFRDTFRHWWLVLRCSVIGIIIGFIPGLGGDVANFLAYGHAVQTSKRPEEFGTGRVEGVLAPESANNSKEGGALVPTVAFGIPGSSGMAIMLGGFMVLGLTPGPEMLTKDLHVVFFMVWVLVIVNIVGALICMFISKPMCKIAMVQADILVPVIIPIAIWGAFSISSNVWDILTLILFGIGGHLMKRFNYSRAVLVLGFILGNLAEKNLWLALKLYGAGFLLRPVTLIELALIITILVTPIIKDRQKQKKEGACA